jgi:hypothetical protein
MTIRPITTSLATLLLLWIAGACTASAESASEERPVAHFSKLVVGNGIDVYLTQAAEESLRVEVEGFALADIVTEVADGTLRLSNTKSRTWFSGDREATVYIGFVQLSDINASSGSDITGRNDFTVDALAVHATSGSDIELGVHAQTLELAISGGSDVDVDGAVQSLKIDASGGSDVDAGSLEAENTVVTASGGSDANVRATASIVIDANGGSDVVVRGDPPERTVNNDQSSDVVWR